MVVIESITVKYFRSIFNINLSGCNHITVLTGLNDVGKSNVLKALNLFFNNQSDWKSVFDFQSDYNIIRKRNVKESIKEQQFISISIKFQRGDRMINSLPPSFTVTRKWDLHDDEYEQSSDVFKIMQVYCKKKDMHYSERNTKTWLSAFLNKIEYVYIPAIKDNAVFANVLFLLQENLFKKGNEAVLQQPISEANILISQMVTGLQTEFKKSTGISSEISIPYSLEFISGLLRIKTETIINDEAVMLEKRGDGIKAHYIPQILNYIAQHSNKIYIWGFEEPENSFEYRRCMQVADEFINKFSKYSQIFITSHSPAFYNNDAPPIKRIFRISLAEGKTELSSCSETIDDELGYAKLYEHFVNDLTELQNQNEKIAMEVQRFKSKLSDIDRPLLLMEGTTDCMLIEHAAKKLNLDKYQTWDIKRAEIESTSGSSALESTIKALLKNIKLNNLVILVFDRDIDIKICDVKIRLVPFLRIKKNLYAFCIPVPHNRVESDDISIEHYFTDDEIKTDINGKRLFLGTEFHKTGIYKGDEDYFYIDKNKCETIKIIEHETSKYVTDKKGEADFSISKTAFASNIVNNVQGFENFSFLEFNKIFDLIDSISADNAAKD